MEVRETAGDSTFCLFIVDTLRADHLGCYGYEGGQTPHIDGLASQGAKLETVVTAASAAAPSVASILTFTFPISHGVRDNELFSLNTECRACRPSFTGPAMLPPASWDQRVAPDYAEVGATEGLIRVREGDLDEGIALMELAIEKDPRAQMAHQTLNNLGLAYLDGEQCDKAIETIEKSLAVKPDYSNAMYNLGLACEKCGNPGEAARAYDALLKANPNLDPALLRSVKTRMENLKAAQGGGG